MSALSEFFKSHGQHLKVPADRPVIRRGAEISRLYFIVDGQVLLHTTSPGGREIAFDIIGPDEVFGFSGLGSDQQAIFDATTLAACGFLTVDSSLIRRLVIENPAAVLEVFDVLLSILRNRTRLAESLAAHSLRARLARWLLARVKNNGVDLQPGVTVPIDLSQRLIAALAGVTRETVNRQLKSWTDLGIISFTGRTLRILKPNDLVQIAGYAEKRMTGDAETVQSD